MVWILDLSDRILNSRKESIMEEPEKSVLL
jgi:hypothetical protein